MLDIFGPSKCREKISICLKNSGSKFAKMLPYINLLTNVLAFFLKECYTYKNSTAINKEKTAT